MNKTKTLREAAQQALDELEHGLQFGTVARAQSLLRAALAAKGEAQPEIPALIDVDEAAGFCRLAFGYGAADFNAGVDAMRDRMRELLAAAQQQDHSEDALDMAEAQQPAPSTPGEAYIDAFNRLIDDNVADALAIVTGTFVSLTLALLRSQGHEPTGDVQIDGGDNRDITIHAKKG